MNTFDIEDWLEKNPPPKARDVPPVVPLTANQDPAVDEQRPEIIVDMNQVGRMTAETIAILANHPNVYRRYRNLAEIISDPGGRVMRNVDVKPGTPMICEIKLAKMHAILSDVISWVKWKKNDDGDWDLMPTLPPDKVVAAVMADTEWKGVKNIEVITESPVFLQDGTILMEKGFYEESGIYYDPNGDFEAIPETVSLEDAQQAAAELGDLVSDFPFQDHEKNSVHKAAWLSALLTPFARFAIPEPCPIFMFDANTAGTGKSLLCDLISILVTGRDMPRTTYPDSDEEMRKRATSIALAGSRLMLLDNIATIFGGATLDAMLTGVSWGDRILGKSEMTQDLLLHTVWYGTGNNLSFRGDMERRVIVCRLVTDEQNPENKSDFKHTRLKQFVSQHRGHYVKLCLTILRGFHQAGRPAHPKPLGTFGSWSDIVRSAVIWATGEDCVVTQEEFRKANPRSNFRIALVHGIHELILGYNKKIEEINRPLHKDKNAKLHKQKQYMPLKEILDFLKASKDSDYQILKQALLTMSKNDDYPSSSHVGNTLAQMRDTVVGKFRLTSKVDPTNGIMAWGIEYREGGSACIAESLGPKSQSSLIKD